MAGRIRQSDIEEVKARTNIADIIGEHVTLKNAGIGSMKGLCPFHDERSPSFHVRPQVGMYHCFGCGESGDVYSFIQKTDHSSFSESVERLAARLGYELHYEDGERPRDQGNRARILAANAAASEYFIAQLATAEAGIGREFLGQRGFDRAAAERFGVGFAPNSWDSLAKHLKGLGFSEAELLLAGLLSQGERGSSYDRFRGRLVWPIRDVTGQTIGFGARKLREDDKGPKYLNTPETPVYHKTQVLYGLDLAKRDIAKGKRVVIVEGYTDVMACHLAGITTAVATCGTAFGVDHIKVMRRILGDDSQGMGEVVFTFDPDAAGQKAAMRAFSEERRFAAQTFVAVAPDGLDPCDLRLNRGDDAVRRMIEDKQPMFAFALKQRIAPFNLETVEGRVGALRAGAPVVADIRDRALQPGYSRELAKMLGIDLAEVNSAVSAARRASGAASKAADQAEGAGTQSRRREPAPLPPAESGWSSPSSAEGGARGGAGAGQSSTTQSSEGQGAAGENVRLGTYADEPREGELSLPARIDPPVAKVRISDIPENPVARLERDALMAILQYPEQIGPELLARATAVGFSSQPLAAVRDAIRRTIDDLTARTWVERVSAMVDDQYRVLVAELAVAPLPERSSGGAELYVKRVTSSLIERDLAKIKKSLLGQLQRIEPGDPARREVELQLVSLEHERRMLLLD